MRAQYASRDHSLVRLFHDDGRVEVHAASDIVIEEVVNGIYVGADCLRAPIEIEAEPDDPDMLLNEPRQRGQTLAVKPSDDTSAAPEAGVPTQAEEVKPTEGDIHEAEYDLHELTGLPGTMIDSRGGVMAANQTEELRAKKIGETVMEHRRLVDASYTVDEALTLQRLRQRSNAQADGSGVALTDAEQSELDRLAMEELWAARMDAELQRRLGILSDPDITIEALTAYSPRGDWTT